MNVFFDNCCSPKLAHTLDGYFRGTDDRAWHIRDCVDAGFSIPSNARDEAWIEALAVDPREWVVVTADGRIAKNKAEREAYRRARLKGILLLPQFTKRSVHEQAVKLLWRWPDAVDTLDRFGPPLLIGLKPGWSAKFDPVQW